MVPNKGTMVEDDDDAYGDDDDPYDFDQTMSRSSRRTTQRSMAFSTVSFYPSRELVWGPATNSDRITARWRQW